MNLFCWMTKSCSESWGSKFAPESGRCFGWDAGKLAHDCEAFFLFFFRAEKWSIPPLRDNEREGWGIWVCFEASGPPLHSLNPLREQDSIGVASSTALNQTCRGLNGGQEEFALRGMFRLLLTLSRFKMPWNAPDSHKTFGMIKYSVILLLNEVLPTT